jgi:hypothetical protein
MTKSEQCPDSLVVGELARRLRTKAATEKKNACHYSATLLERSARLLETYGCPGGVKLAPEQAESIAGLLKLICILEPIAVSKRLPGPEDCQFKPGATIGYCWWWYPPTNTLGTGGWSFEPWEWVDDATHWLPAHSLPIPEQL